MENINVTVTSPLLYSVQKLYASWIETKLGKMLAICDDDCLYLLEFVDRIGLEKEVANLKNQLKAQVIFRETKLIAKLKLELSEYFSTGKACFTVKIKPIGTNFQLKVWKQLQKVKSGTTISYEELAHRIGNPKAYRAVAKANSTNHIAIIIPCHRVINKSGNLGGYSGGLFRKKELLLNETK